MNNLLIALGVALAVASSPSDAALSKKAIRKIVNKEITKRAPALRVVGPIGPQGPIGPAGPVGVKGSLGSPGIEMYAHVLENGTVVPEHSYGITQGHLELRGNRYCFTGLPYVNVGQVTMDVFESTGNKTAKFSRRNATDCEIFVQIFDGANRLTTGGFYLMLY